MTEQRLNTAKDAPPRRPWHRLHGSTYAVAVFLLVVLVLIIVPGEWALNHDRFEHGWPWTYLLRLDVEPPRPWNVGPRPEAWQIWEGPPWLRGASWAMTGGRIRFRPAAVAGDVFVGLLILAVGVAVFECWRRRRRRVWQFTLRELLLGVLLLACVLGWWRHAHVRAEREVEVIRREGSDATAVELLMHLNRGFGREYRLDCRAPKWIRKLLGRRLLVDFCTVAEDPPAINSPDRLRWRLEYTGGLPAPRTVRLLNSTLAAARLEALAGLNSLCVLELYGCRLEKGGIGHLAEMRTLRELTLCNCTTDATILERVGQLPRLRLLCLCRTLITDASLRHLAGLPELRELDLSYCGITNQGLSHLESLTSLRKLQLDRAGKTPQAIERLQRALPECEIVVQ